MSTTLNLQKVMGVPFLPTVQVVGEGIMVWHYCSWFGLVPIKENPRESREPRASTFMGTVWGGGSLRGSFRVGELECPAKITVLNPNRY